MDIYGRIMSDPVNKWVFTNSPKDTFLTGGCIRDILLGRTSGDRDFSVKGDVRDIALRFREKFGGKCIELKENQTFRIVMNKREFIDFNRLDMPIMEDLGRRDFTVNAMAWSPDKGLLDPFNGTSALLNKTITMVNQSNFLDDPVRILRGYRIAARLGFDIDTLTRHCLKKYSGLLKRSSFERTTEEFFKLLNSDLSLKYLKLCFDDNVLHYIIDVNNLNLINCFDLLHRFERIIQKLINNKYKGIDNKEILKKLTQHVSQGLDRKGFILLSILTLHAAVQYKYHTVGCLKLSSTLSGKIIDIHNGFSFFSERISDSGLTSLNVLFEIYKHSGRSVLEMSMILSVLKKRGAERFIRKAYDYVKVEHNSLISGEDIKKILNTGQGRLIGQIKDRLIKEQFLGKITKRSEAKEWIISNFT